jgi:coenzyme Q-binding protein COQ10
LSHKHIKKSSFFAAPREIVYQVVADVARYPEFLPGMLSVNVRNGHVKMTAGEGPVRVSWTSTPIFEPPRHIAFKLVEGPFIVMDGSWTFEEVPGGTQVTYLLEYELLWPIPGASVLVGINSESAIAAFQRRVQQLLAKRGRV